MNHLTHIYEVNLKPLKVRFYIAAALLLVVAIFCVSQQRSRVLLKTTLDGLVRAQSGVARVKEANANRRHILTLLQSQLGQGVKNNSTEMVLYGKIDEIKSRFIPDEMTISAVDKKGGEAVIQYTLTFNNPDFNTLLNAVSNLHKGVFPLTPVSAIAVAQSDAGGVSFKVSGKVVAIEKTLP